MKIVLLRHGLTEAHEANTRQTETDILSETGREQAKKIAKHLKENGYNFDKILSSTTTRAKETAEIIAEHINYTDEIIKESIFKEIKAPSILYGKPKDDPIVKETLQEMKKHISEPEWKHSDGESFVEAFLRAKQSLEIIKSQNANEILILSHSSFIKLISLLLIYGDELPSIFFGKMKSGVELKNCGFVELSNEENNWSIEKIFNL